ncbi:FxLD family lanthipeptide [Natronosporangium hydrolyticum]|uniref:FxLD family lanthipeptide n=1 Tax=Natronosporangium hydrolyticum TaxID=2811111 RepID=A0A895YK22_9ACTN|nr:FxLD family lanthipeptide [Natronosporangium hydrolyticum]QSB14158.1 FxLD family lanthipeptide [Natronosporangium hydrolyticum]
MPPVLMLDEADTSTPIPDEEFELDLRVVQTTAAVTSMRCDTSDNCGATCGTSACNSGSLDPS